MMKWSISLLFFFNFISNSNATQNTKIIPGKFIVVLSKSFSPDRFASEHQIKPDHIYKKAINGFSARLSEVSHQRLLQDYRVAFIEPDQIVALDPVLDIDQEIKNKQANAPWGIDRIDQRSLPLDTQYNYLATGLGVTAYIIDTGIRFDHVEFNGRASLGFDAFNGTGVDCNGHGTHVSGTVGGHTYGVAKDVSLKSIRVLDCDGSGKISGVLAGIDWIIDNATFPAIANMSLGANGGSFVIDQAVTNLIYSGIQVAIAAGNSKKNACGFSPARIADGITVGATGKTDERPSWSNFGDCVDLFAPGENILSAWSTGPGGSNNISGTSMAAPHVAGVAALYLQTHPNADYQEVRDNLLAYSSKNKVSGSNSRNNHLIYNLETVEGNGDTTSPTTIITSPVNDSMVSRRSTVSIKAGATDNLGLSSVKFYVNGILMCTDTSSPFSCSWRVPNTANQAYYLQAVAADAAGNTAGSPYILVNSN